MNFWKNVEKGKKFASCLAITFIKGICALADGCAKMVSYMTKNVSDDTCTYMEMSER